MAHGLEPTEEYDGSVSVRLLDDTGANEEIRCASYEAAIDVVKENEDAVTVAKIVDRDGDVVFTSADGDIRDWETEWTHAKHRIAADVEKYDCPYDNVACFADDRCVQCKMDEVQSRY